MLSFNSSLSWLKTKPCETKKKIRRSLRHPAPGSPLRHRPPRRCCSSKDTVSQHGVESVTTTAKHLIFPNRDQPGMATSAIFMTVEGQKGLYDVNVTEWGLDRNWVAVA